MKLLPIKSSLCLLCFLYGFHGSAQKDSLSLLALGDSYTIGTSELYQHCWPVQLRKKLNKKDNSIKKPKIIAGAGWTSEKLIKEINKEQLSPNYDLVFLLIGVNNQYRNLDILQFREDFIWLLDKSITLAKNDTTKVIVLSIPDWSVTPFARFKDKSKIAKDIGAYNTIIEAEALKRKLHFINITKLSRKAKYNKSLLANDSLHPSKRMYKEWVSKISKVLKSTLN